MLGQVGGMAATLVDRRVTARAGPVIINGGGRVRPRRAGLAALRAPGHRCRRARARHPRLGVARRGWGGRGAGAGRREALGGEGVPARGIRRPAVVRMAWVRRRPGEHRDAVAERVAEAAVGWTVLVVNVDPDDVPREAAARVLDRAWLADALERSGELRLAHPAALGL